MIELFDGIITITRRYIAFWGYEIYFYAIIIVTGIIAAMIVASRLLRQKGVLSDVVLDYAIFVLPLAIIGCRVYFLFFPYDYVTYEMFEKSWTWENFWAIRNGGLGIYGGVIFGYLTAYVVTKVKKLHFDEVADSIIPGLFLAQAIGRWGNFVNQEAYGNIVTNPNMQWFPYAVNVDGSFYQATFFYESVFTLLGFFICLVIINRKWYKNGVVASFYGVYYGLVRLFIEGLRSDSLYLRIPNFFARSFIETDIKVSQLVSIICIVYGIVRIILLYGKDIIKKISPTKKAEAN